MDFRNKIENADGIVICTPEYVFSIPSGLKNTIEWCVSTNAFSNKPTETYNRFSKCRKGP
ncbi:NAD(P)H-dependent oxidoreductase [uncultured Algibacter sp.]|uniref:NADPH-dependent FMN reductase n=1 Tax=uncultured Algibacter sp. TaxID=298659 RepID=UPI00341A6F59